MIARHYSNNARLLKWSMLFRGVSVSAAYLTPFFIGKGLSTAEIFLLQSVFSLTLVALEIPSGYLADRIGRAKCVKLSHPIACVGLIAYGLGDSILYFAVCELLLGIANSLISGADDALLVDSLHADGKSHEQEKVMQEIRAIGFSSMALGLPISILAVKHFGISATLIADGLLTMLGGVFIYRLVEAPHVKGRNRPKFVHAVATVVSNRTARMLMLLSMMLNSTYFAAWLAPLYYSEIGVPITMFAVVVAGRSAFKFFLGMYFRKIAMGERSMRRLIAAGLLGNVAMASGVPWLSPGLLGHDAVHMLHNAPLSVALNREFSSDIRATQGSVVNCSMRLYFAVMGPFVGLAVDTWGLMAAGLAIGFTTTAGASLALVALNRNSVFEKR